MQEPARILSQEQKSVLATIFHFIESATIYFRSVLPVVGKTVERLLKALVDLAESCMRNLATILSGTSRDCRRAGKAGWVLMSKAPGKEAPPVKYLLECSDNEVGNFELVKLGEVSNLRREMLELFNKLVDTSAMAVLAAWLRTIDRNELRRQLLESPDATIEVIMAEAKAQIPNQRRSPEELEYGPMPGPGFLRKLPPEEARRRSLESTKRREERHIAAGKCRKCSAPLCRESVDYCTKHLAKRREAQRRRKGTVHAHGRHPNTLKALKKANATRRKSH